ncbi:hypothetical protein E3E23_01730 [Thermococcus sp. CX2]|uniref:SigmaK-factor processing regulatory BofA n=1 Tax=Thermococcus piezophilus TaxID=1712654 RepID=A0A172WIC6_9EURY|nr:MULTISPECIES: pro-sigmaK processing inhibitor BofA family protein [Thermococcus]ANF23218.1 hypothetical protein A7C91_08580 [Thermococcus piezophilus]NJE84565.1 hypothetical protein [Thermococcus sp. CX2]
MIETLLFLFLLAFVLYLVFKLTIAILKYLITNAVIGLILLWILNAVGIANVPFTFINILIVAVGGVFGVILLMILSWL